VSRRPAPGAKKQQTLGAQFKAQLGSLVDKINATAVHYVRCIKPNACKSASEFERPMVTDQLRCQVWCRPCFLAV
jgi:myosin-5